MRAFRLGAAVTCPVNSFQGQRWLCCALSMACVHSHSTQPAAVCQGPALDPDRSVVVLTIVRSPTQQHVLVAVISSHLLAVCSLLCCPCVQLPAGSVDVELLHDATRREARAAA